MNAIISATNRTDSYTRRVATWLHTQVQTTDPQCDFIDLLDLPDAFLATDLYGKRSEAFGSMEQRLRKADKYLIVVPEYNGSFPGVVKLLIDALPRDVFSGKKAAFCGLGAGKFGNLRGLDHLNAVCNYIQLNTLPFRAHLQRVDQVFSLEQPTDEASEKELRMLLEKFLAF